MEYKQQTLNELDKKSSNISGKSALAGLDGFVDKIMHVVARRMGQGDDFEAIETIEAFGKRILGAAGKSTNIEIYPVMEKIGGNGPIMANALLASGLDVRYIGALGHPDIFPVFQEFAEKTKAVSIADPGITNALEFTDGKVMMGTMASLDNITYQQILNVMGEGAFIDAISRPNLIAMVNWTMIPNKTQILSSILDKILPNLGPLEGGRTFFFDLADPEKRSEGDVRTVLRIISRYRSHGRVILGLNFKEAQQIWALHGKEPLEPEESSLKKMATWLRQELDIACVLIHPVHCAACATRDGAWFVTGPYTKKPKITTGAGDHFNAGFCVGQLIGLSPEASLTVAVAFSGYYVRNAKSPSLYNVDSFIRSWED